MDHSQLETETNQLPKKKTRLKSLLEKKPTSNIIKSLITTTLGVIIILGSLFSSIVMNNNWSDTIWGLALGLGLLFAPDEILVKLRNFIK